MIKKFIAWQMYQHCKRQYKKNPDIHTLAEMAKWNNRWYRLAYPNAIQRAWD